MNEGFFESTNSLNEELDKILRCLGNTSKNLDDYLYLLKVIAQALEKGNEGLAFAYRGHLFSIKVEEGRIL